MIGSDYVLEAHNIYHTTEVDGGGCLSGGGNSALVLKGVSLTVHSGEVMAILGSKGSGKRALLDVIARRTDDTSRGQVQLNGTPLTRSSFQQRCGYVTHSCSFIPGLTVSQTLHYSPTTLTGYIRNSKVRQVLADLALSQVANKRVENLNISEARRLAIGIQLVRDPVILLLDEPTQGLDPLSAYLLISILSNTAKKTGCGILLSLEKPRSDVFPFLDRALFLCLGGVVYSGGTRAMLEYFHGIGFPCPQLENPLMYYLCLSTVDRRSRDRFLESSQQIEALVQRFGREMIVPESPMGASGLGKIPLAYGKPGECAVWAMLYVKLLASTFAAGWTGVRSFVQRLLVLPAAMALLWCAYRRTTDDAHGAYTKNGLILNILGLSYAAGMLTTVSLFPAWRRRFAHDQSDGLYSGATLLLAYDAVSLPFSAVAAGLATCIVYPLGPVSFAQPLGMAFVQLFIAIWTSAVLAEQMCIAFLLVVRSRINTTIAVSYLLVISLTLASGTVRSFRGIQPWLQENTKATHTRYAALLLHAALFGAGGGGGGQQAVATTTTQLLTDGGAAGASDAAAEYVAERMGRGYAADHVDLALAVAFVVGVALVNMLLYLMPLPKHIVRKFRD